MPNARAGAIVCERLFGLINRIRKQQLAEDVGQEAKWAAGRSQRKVDRVDRARVHKEEMAAERAKREEARVDRARIRKEQRTRRLELIRAQKQKRQ